MKKRTLIIVATLILLGAAGIAVALNLQREENQEPVSRPSSQESVKPADLTQDWKEYVHESGAFSFKYPASWLIKDKARGCSVDVVLAAEASALSNCQTGATGDPGQIWMAYKRGNFDSFYRLVEGKGVTGVTTKQVTVDNVKGIRQEGIGQNPHNQSFGFPNGGKVIRYILVLDGYTLQATYNQKATYPDSSEDFDKLVTHTMSFTKN